jgi:hypothetical protein
MKFDGNLAWPIIGVIVLATVIENVIRFTVFYFPDSVSSAINAGMVMAGFLAYFWLSSRRRGSK